MAFWHEFPFDLCYFAAPQFCDARWRLLRRLVAFIFPKSHQILKIFFLIFFFIYIYFLFGVFFLSVIIWIGSWTKTRCLYAVSFDLAGTFGHTLFNDFYKMNFKKNKTFCSWMVETFDRQVFRLTDSWCTKTTS